MIDIDSITFTDQGLAITYMDTSDARGKVIVAHQIQLHHSHPDYREDSQRLAELARAVVNNALEDWANTPTTSQRDDDVDDDDRGMGE